ncbi:MAG: aspartate aminotransferase family protein [Dehalococcoidia bacterium]
MTLSLPELEDTYRQRFPKSAALYERAGEVFVDGVTHDTRRVLPYPIYVERAQGSRKWDVDGNELVDWVSGHGALLLGHNHPTVIEAAQKQLAKGTHYGAGHEAEIRWGEWVKKLVPSAESVRFTSSGTEATLLALRIARAATGRTHVIKFAGHFHGWHDYTMRGRGASSDRVAGVPEQVDATVSLLSPEIGAVAETVAANDDVAAVIVEPSGAAWGTAPLKAGFLQELRELTASKGIVLIFDEVVTGFRWAPGGVQELSGVIPDITTLAKILAGGLPGGAVAGRADLMETLAWIRSQEKPSRKIPHYGTFNANPLSAAAGAACLEIVADGVPQERADATALELRRGLSGVLQELELPGFVYGDSSTFHIVLGRGTGADGEKADRGEMDDDGLLLAPYTRAALALQQAMLVEGVHLFNMGGLVSSVHSPEDVEKTVDAFRRSLPVVEPLL